MENELKSHSAIITKLAEKGNELIKSRQSCKEIAQTACQNLEQSLRKLQKAASNRQRRILEDRDAFQVRKLSFLSESKKGCFAICLQFLFKLLKSTASHVTFILLWLSKLDLF